MKRLISFQSCSPASDGFFILFKARCRPGNFATRKLKHANVWSERIVKDYLTDTFDWHTSQRITWIKKYLKTKHSKDEIWVFFFSFLLSFVLSFFSPVLYLSLSLIRRTFLNWLNCVCVLLIEWTRIKIDNKYFILDILVKTGSKNYGIFLFLRYSPHFFFMQRSSLHFHACCTSWPEVRTPPSHGDSGQLTDYSFSFCLEEL